MKGLLARFAKDESGATAVEYGLIAALSQAVCCTKVRGSVKAVIDGSSM